MKRILLTLIVLLFLSSAAVPARATDEDSFSGLQPPDVGSETAVLMDADTGQVLYQKDMDKQMYPASITKIMTGMLGLSKGKLSDIVTMSDDAVKTVDIDSANIALSPGEQLTMEQALYAISIASANDAANGIAEAVGGSLQGFVAMMNAAAKEAGAVNTHFDNANGLPDEDHYTTAHDMALITAQALKVPGFTEIFGAKRYKIPPTNKQPETRIVNSSNRFLDGDITYDGMLISKAGWTNEAQHTLVTAAQRNGTTLVVVVMKSSDSTVKWTDTTSLLDYGFDQFERFTISKEDILRAIPANLSVPGMENSEIDPESYAAGDVPLLLPKGCSPDDIEISCGTPLDTSSNKATIPVQLRLPSETGADPILLEETAVRASIRPASSEPVTKGELPAKPATKSGVWRMVLTVLGALVAAVLATFIFLIVRRAVIVRRRKKRRQQKRRRPAAPGSDNKFIIDPNYRPKK